MKRTKTLWHTKKIKVNESNQVHARDRKMGNEKQIAQELKL